MIRFVSICLILLQQAVAVASVGRVVLGQRIQAIPRKMDINLSVAVFGPNPASIPDLVQYDTFFGWEINANAQTWSGTVNIPDDWIGPGTALSDWPMHIHFFPTAGTPIADGETVKFSCTHRVIDVHGTDASDEGTASTVNVTYTQSGAGINKQALYVGFDIPHDDANNPIVAGYEGAMTCYRDATADTYAAAIVLWKVSLNYYSTGFSTQ